MNFKDLMRFKQEATEERFKELVIKKYGVDGYSEYEQLIKNYDDQLSELEQTANKIKNKFKHNAAKYQKIADQVAKEQHHYTI